MSETQMLALFFLEENIISTEGGWFSVENLDTELEFLH